MTDADLLPLPIEMNVYRDSLRIVGYELVRYTLAHASREAMPYRHPAEDYEYAIHKIDQVAAGQVFIQHDATYCSAARVPAWTKLRLDQERPEGAGWVKRWAKENWLLTIVATPYSLALLGLGAVGDHQTKKAQQATAKLLSQYLPMAKFAPPRRRPI